MIFIYIHMLPYYSTAKHMILLPAFCENSCCGIIFSFNIIF